MEDVLKGAGSSMTVDADCEVYPVFPLQMRNTQATIDTAPQYHKFPCQYRIS